MNFNTSSRFTFSYLVRLVNLVHRNDITGSIWVHILFSTHNIFLNMECKVAAYIFPVLVNSRLYSVDSFFAGYDTVASMYSLNNAIDSSIVIFHKQLYFPIF